MIDWLNNNAGSVTAVATAIYALITLVLAFEARAARQLAAATAKRADAAASQADAALREERELNVLPYLAAISRPQWQPDGSLGLQISAENVTDHPALRVTVKLLHGPWDHSAPTDREPDARLLRDSPRFYAVVTRDMKEKTFGWNIQASDVPEITIVRMRYHGPLGGTVWQTYELRRFDGRFTFLDLQRFVLSSVPGAKPVIT